jgi:hypothetical protein
MCRSDVVGGEFLRGAFGLDVTGSVRSQNEREEERAIGKDRAIQVDNYAV